ncbi:Smr/MutS family protein [Neoehrlichia mikurensis]|uniref:Smr/MutS family protein n=1 Tax=Neoehrlichia mikurensis TaxID=89586 RepID=A0A9Q9BSG8_9RICK|nr:Smr/MutS family protein [Neoehrlichia mikurensis]QXK92079.1 Smr/MutS family protein [Neoehrlichia mikurensis]QXK92536.1 Smr/MutS family protein [Neoehrlichia mikurensis]QXK93772.1 Smr/MutS family protein [Neoehrlichia mikurensis]UTO55252.1 Smr/MutS family protein [Neoehrlichia mikurensis]UTO56173.1 Smr/MutS family protein [Neoehrlichia mikurensis]
MINNQQDTSWQSIISDTRPSVSKKIQYQKHNSNTPNIIQKEYFSKSFKKDTILLNTNKSSHERLTTYPHKAILPYYYCNNEPRINVQEKNYNIESGTFNSISNSTKVKIDQGKYHIDSILDLHGYTHDEAYYQLLNCITKNYDLGNKCLLVITGWGSKFSGHNSIRNSLHKWLQNDKIANLMLYYKQAIAAHGGKGAFYLLLKTKDKYSRY